MIFTNFDNYCTDCPFIDVVVETKRSCDIDGEPVMTTTKITCKNIDICRRIANKRGDPD